MSTRMVTAVSAGLLGAAIAVAPQPASAQEPPGLWPTSQTTGQVAADCGKWRLDENGFCVANDARNGLEIGTKFRSSTTLRITGVRIYRADPGSLRASLWDADGTLLARGRFADRGSNGWQDMTFQDPVTIAPGTTYIASYFTPATKYAFQYGYFKDSSRTVGPVTALKSVDGSPNGVHCYEVADCTFPVRDYRDSTYWVTPLWRVPGGGSGSTGGGGGEGAAPRVVATTPDAGAERARRGSDIKVRFSEPVRRSTLNGKTVRLVRAGSSEAVAVRLRYEAGRQRVVIDPRSALRPGTRYEVRITTGVRDQSGTRLDQNRKKAGAQSATWTFRTRR